VIFRGTIMKTKSIRKVRALPPDIPGGIQDLVELSRNLWWSWDSGATALWDEAARRLGIPPGEWPPRNPVRLLARRDRKALEMLVSDAEFRKRLHRTCARFRRAMKQQAPDSFRLPGPVAYFCMEFGVHESLPIYSGGLGILAGDHVKTASDLSFPLVGVGLFYREGYFRQEMDGRGRHVVAYSRADPRALPLEPCRDSRGRELRVTVDLAGRPVELRIWRVQVGRVDLLLLDSHVPENSPGDRALTHRLYIGSREKRMSQEVLCGIGGVRALRALGIQPAVWHMNEGHVAFLTLERLGELTGDGKFTLAEAMEVVSADCVFTTHTPVPAGNEIFRLDLARRYLEPHCRAARIPVEEYLNLGLDVTDGGTPLFSMTVLALRLSRFRNGVSRLHGEVSREMWNWLWPGLLEAEVPIGSVTNGIHVATWISPEHNELYCRIRGRSPAERPDDPRSWRLALKDEDLWEIKRILKSRLIDYARDRLTRQMVKNGAPARRAAGKVLDPEAFTIGFSRRFAPYKRAGLLFRDLRRAKRLFSDPRRPVQIIFAGKPHPDDPEGQELFNAISAICRRKEFAGRVVLLPDYDMEMGRHLVQGVDLWLNTPRRPLEACGTSGQKVPINGGLNLSTLDGWWCEGSAPDTGWATGKARKFKSTEQQDREDARDLYRVLTGKVLPLYFHRGRDGIPREWLKMVKSSLARLAPRFSSAHMLREYIGNYYLAAAELGQELRGHGGRKARRLAAWRRKIEFSWPLVHVIRSGRIRKGRQIEVDIFAGGMGPDDLAAGYHSGDSRSSRLRARNLTGGVIRFSFPAKTGVPAYLIIWPHHEDLPNPMEVGLSLEVKV